MEIEFNQILARLERLAVDETKEASTRQRTPLTSTFSANDFSGFETFGENSLSEAVKGAVSFLNDISAPMGTKGGRWLTLTGTSGLGKTYLSKLILSHYRRKVESKLLNHALKHNDRHIPSFEAEFVKWRRVSEEIKRGQWGAASHYIEPYLLVLDDIGDDESGTKMDNITAGKLYDLLDSRIGKWTIITSNRSLKHIAEKERRLASRMIRDGNVAIQLAGEDYSIRKLRKQTNGKSK